MGISAIIPLALSGISVGSNIIQGVEARKKGRAAERAADDALAAAKRRTGIDRFEGLQIPTEAYELAQEGRVQSQQQNLMALQEAGPRALAAGVGKITAAGIQGGEKDRISMSRDLYDLSKLQAVEAAKRDTALASIDLKTVEGAGFASMAAEQQAAAAFGGAAQTAAKAGMDVYKASELYGADFSSSQAKDALDKGLITQDQVSSYKKYVDFLEKSDFRRLNDQERIAGFEEFYKTNQLDPIELMAPYIDQPTDVPVEQIYDLPTMDVNAGSFTDLA